MVVFGGFEDNYRVNTLQIYNFEESRWSFPENDIGDPVPEARAGHSSVIYKNKLYIFGGTNKDNIRIADIWVYNLSTNTWEEINTSKQVFKMSPRSGHSATIFKDYMIVFGGMMSVTKEIDDTCAFNFRTKEWIQIFGEKKTTVSAK